MLKVFLVLALGFTLLYLSSCGREEPLKAPEDTIIGSQLDPYNKARNFEIEYEQGLDQKREDMDRAIDGG